MQECKRCKLLYKKLSKYTVSNLLYTGVQEGYNSVQIKYQMCKGSKLVYARV